MTGILRILYTAFTIVFLATTLQVNSTIGPAGGGTAVFGTTRKGQA